MYKDSVYIQNVLKNIINKCIGDDTKAAARESPALGKQKKIQRRTIFNMADGILPLCNVERGSGMT